METVEGNLSIRITVLDVILNVDKEIQYHIHCMRKFPLELVNWI